MHSQIWPLWDLRISTPRLELTVVREADLEPLVALAMGGIHRPDEMPFEDPWTDLRPPEFEYSMLQFLWRCLGNLSASSWRIPFVIRQNSEVVGLQDVAAEDFGVRGVVTTGSWLGKAHQGQGLGKEMRAGVLTFVFDYLGAKRAETCAFEDNAASIGVTRALGYEPNGVAVTNQRGRPARDLKFVLTGAAWPDSSAHEYDIQVSGVGEALRAQLGCG
jgi:RimJ/RimL family protein N-acetyltransferase